MRRIAHGVSCIPHTFTHRVVTVIDEENRCSNQWTCLKLINLCASYGKCVSCSVMSNSLQPHGLWPTWLPCQWNSPGKNTGVGSQLFPSPGDLPNPGTEPRSPALQVNFLPSGPPQKPASYWARSQNLLWFQRLLFPNSMPLPFFKMWENLDLMDLD